MMSMRRMPWHRLGVFLDERPDTLDDALAAAGLMWTVAKERLYRADGQLIDGHRRNGHRVADTDAAGRTAGPSRRHRALARRGADLAKDRDRLHARDIMPPARPDLLLAGPADRVGRGGRIVVSLDGGDTWQPVGTALTFRWPTRSSSSSPRPTTPSGPCAPAGGLLHASPEDWAWSAVLPAGTGLSVTSIAFVTR